MIESKPSVDDYKVVLKTVLENLKIHQKDFEGIRQSKVSLIRRWGAVIDILMPLQMSAAKEIMPEEPLWMLSFNKHLNEHKAIDSELKRLDEQKWLYCLKHAFGINSILGISLDEARTLARAIASSNDDGQLESLKKTCSPEEVMYEMMMALEKPVFEEHGYLGEEGYIQAQKSILEYFDDPLIVEYGKEVHRKMLHQQAQEA